MGKSDEEAGSVEVILPDGFGSSFSTKEIRAKVILKNQQILTICSWNFLCWLDSFMNAWVRITFSFFSVYPESVCYTI